MTQFRISGIWKNDKGTITHYAIHTKLANGNYTRSSKTSKLEAIRLLEVYGNSAKTWLWNYSRADWDEGEDVRVVGSGLNKYLRTDPDNTTRDNLYSLINYNWITS